MVADAWHATQRAASSLVPPVVDARRRTLVQREEKTMPAYLIVHATVRDEAQYQKYREAVVPLINKHGGRFIIRGGKAEVLEGSPETRRWVVFEFPSMDAIRTFWNSPEYVPVKSLRQGAATLDILAVEGV
jgi:uncharacterized protein (DUF1330 family)